MSAAPTFGQVLRLAMRTHMSDVHVSMPGRIESYEAGTQKASVQPLLQLTLEDGTRQRLPVINNVPVVWPRGGGAILSFPLAAGDGVLLIFSERSLDEWLAQGGETAPDDPRSFDLSDAIAVPGLYPFSAASDADERDVLLKFRGTELRLGADGDVGIKTTAGFLRINKDGTVALGGAQELVAIVDELLTSLLSMTVFTGATGAQPAMNLAAFASLKVRLATIKEKGA